MSGHGDRLDGWKAIADFLARDERTVQRWAKERGLPVHRMPGGKGASVFALRAELEQWVAGAPQVAPVATGHISFSEAHVPPESRSTPRVRRAKPRLLLAGLALVAVSVLVWTVAVREAPIPDSIESAPNVIVAWAGGEVLWRYSLLRPTDTPLDTHWRLMPSVPGAISDITGDDRPEILAPIVLAGANGRFVASEFLCLSAAGKLRWRYAPSVSLTFEEQTYDGPWRILSWIATDGAGGRLVWVSVIHHVWWPTFLTSIDPTGQATIRFVHPGHIFSMAQVTSDETSYLVAGGINNEYASAMIAFVDENGPPAVPPSSNPRFMCRECPQGQLARYMLFPRSELNHLLGRPYNRVYEVAESNSRLTVSVEESSAPHLRVVYQLSRSLVPESVGFSDAYWEAHRGLEREGRLDHPAEACPTRRDGMTVRVWEPEGGWSELVVPVGGG